MTSDVEELARKITKELSDAGKVIEGGWASFRIMTMHKDAPQIQVDEMRSAFFAGAQHLFSSIMVMLDPGLEETEQDLRRMGLIAKELDDFVCAYKEKHFSYGQKGSA